MPNIIPKHEKQWWVVITALQEVLEDYVGVTVGPHALTVARFFGQNLLSTAPIKGAIFFSFLAQQKYYSIRSLDP